MQDWQQRLYDTYISTGQAGSNVNLAEGLHLRDYPYMTKLIKKHVPHDRDIAIVDLACGHGALVYCLRAMGYTNVKAVDTSREQVELSRQLGIEDIECTDIQSFLAKSDQRYDVIFLMDILEHIPINALLDLLELVNASLKEDGRVIIHVPNAEGIFGMRIRYGDLTHMHCFTPDSIRQLLSTGGFKHMQCFEDQPVVHGVKSFLRYLVWHALIWPFRLLLTAETGSRQHILSQNMLVIGTRKSPKYAA